jgi:HAD superfamily hydrolase (TIGR01509 family)
MRLGGREIKAVVFDMDGLLFNTESLAWEAFQPAAATYGRPVAYEDYVDLIGGPIERTRGLLANWFGAEPQQAFFDDWRARYDAIRRARLQVKPGVRALLSALQARAAPCALCTSSAPDHVQENFKLSGLGGFFNAIVARGDYANGKPAPDPYLEAARRLRIAPEHCLALEDSYNGVRSASAAGMVTIMAPDLLAPTDEMRALAHHVAQDLNEVCALLLGSKKS